MDRKVRSLKYLSIVNIVVCFLKTHFSTNLLLNCKNTAFSELFSYPKSSLNSGSTVFSATKIEIIHSTDTYLVLEYIRKYPLCRYILDVLTNTIACAWDQLWGNAETLKCVLNEIY